MAEERRIIIARENRPFYRPRYHWTVERMDGGPDLQHEGHAFTHRKALGSAAFYCHGIGPYERTEAIVVSKWKRSATPSKRPSPLAPELIGDQQESRE